MLGLHNMIQLNKFSAFGSILYLFHRQKVKNTHIYSKMSWTHATYDVVSCYHSNQLLPYFTKRCQKEQTKSCWWLLVSLPVVRPRVKKILVFSPLKSLRIFKVTNTVIPNSFSSEMIGWVPLIIPKLLVLFSPFKNLIVYLVAFGN